MSTYHIFEVVLKNGFLFTTKAEDCEITYNTMNGSLTRYEFKNISGDNYPMYIKPSEIVAILKRN